MPKYWRQSLGGLGHHVEPVIGPLNGLRPMRGSPVEAIMRAQDHVSAMSRRIVASGGMRGSLTWTTPDTDPTAMAGTHPGPDERRLIGAGSVDLTPGCFLRLWAIVSPSGETQITGTTPGGASGLVEVTVLWTDAEGGTETTVHSAVLPASTETFGAQPANMWVELSVASIVAIEPPLINDTAELRRWSRSANAQVTISAVGGARIVDAVVFEWPRDVAFEADDAGDLWTSHLYGTGSPSGAGQPLQYPYQRFLESTPDGNPRGGTFQLMDVHHAQHQRLGPVLFSWSGAQESTGEEGVSITSQTFVELAGGGSTAFTLTEPGLAVGTGGYARRYSSNSPFVLRDRVAAIPVFVRALASSTGNGGVIRTQTRTDSYVDLVVPPGAQGWHVIYGWLEVGINPDDTSRLIGQLFGQASADASPNLVVNAVTVHYAGGYTPAV